MGISKLRSFTADAVVCGQMRSVSWDEDNQTFMVHDLESFVEMTEILDKLAEGGLKTFTKEQMDKLSPDVEDVAQEQPPKAPIQVVAAPVQPAVVPEAEPAVVVVDTTTPVEQTVTNGTHPDTLPKWMGGDLPKGPDLTTNLQVFSNMTRLKEVLVELKKRGVTTLPDMIAACNKLKETEVCLVLDRITDIPARVTTTAALLGIQ